MISDTFAKMIVLRERAGNQSAKFALAIHVRGKHICISSYVSTTFGITRTMDLKFYEGSRKARIFTANYYFAKFDRTVCNL